ncbi:methyltransferase [Couchioplanes caeruleus]|uniref:Methyltransferase type 12 n=2 Tax=Couchioplanes caeruleus TaxID=56438 RepID=A0A1K0FT92_9ACTN|nr:methyltransferase [Couchioplanes caeruleus]OJF15880.1 methyltransferase type 12 [Couchioplanes caeruleus subsp. caeruleus]ROP28447.1 methyltransferase family protein [Couchioplanes caeruleus]
MPVPLTPEEAAGIPGAHLDLLSTVGFHAAGTAQRLGVFEALTRGALHADELAGRLDLDPDGARVLCDTLVAFGYLTRVGGAYTNSPDAVRWLLREGSDSYAPVLSFWHTVLTERWGGLEESLRRGKPDGDFYAWLDARPDTLADFHTMLSRLAGWLAGEVVPRVPVPDGPASLLDLGGGHAAYPVALCAAYPELRAKVVDLAGALEQGRATVAAAGLTDRIELCPGDLFTADLGTGHDVALLFNIVHGYRPAEVATLLGRVAAALRPGGRLLLLEPLADVERPPGPAEAFVQAFSLNLFHTQGGRVYGYAELTTLLTDAGFTSVDRHVLERSPTDHLVTAVRGSRS